MEQVITEQEPYDTQATLRSTTGSYSACCIDVDVGVAQVVYFLHTKIVLTQQLSMRAPKQGQKYFEAVPFDLQFDKDGSRVYSARREGVHPRRWTDPAAHDQTRRGQQLGGVPKELGR